jgi:hypothetical protein
MEPAGMVHALEIIRRLLRPHGKLIDIHPVGEPSPVEVRVGGQITLTGWLTETDDFIEYRQAGDALAQAVQRGWFLVEREATFPFITHADSMSELLEYLAKEWQDAILDDQTARKAEELLAGPERDKELLVHDRIRILQLSDI